MGGGGGGIFRGAIFLGGNFLGAIFLGSNFPEGIFPGAFFLEPISPSHTYRLMMSGVHYWIKMQWILPDILYQNDEIKKWLNKHEYGEFVSLFARSHYLMQWISFPHYFEFIIYWFITFSFHTWIQLFFNVINRIKIINRAWLGLLSSIINLSITICTCCTQVFHVDERISWGNHL